MRMKMKKKVEKEVLHTTKNEPELPPKGAPPPPPDTKEETRFFQVHGGEKQWLTKHEAKLKGLHWVDKKK